MIDGICMQSKYVHSAKSQSTSPVMRNFYLQNPQHAHYGQQRSKVYKIGLSSRIGDMKLWDEPKDELAIMFLTSNHIHELGGQK